MKPLQKRGRECIRDRRGAAGIALSLRPPLQRAHAPFPREPGQRKQAVRWRATRSLPRNRSGLATSHIGGPTCECGLRMNGRDHQREELTSKGSEGAIRSGESKARFSGDVASRATRSTKPGAKKTQQVSTGFASAISIPYLSPAERTKKLERSTTSDRPPTIQVTLPWRTVLIDNGP